MRMIPDAELRVLFESLEVTPGLIQPLSSGDRPRPWEDDVDYPGDDAHEPWTPPVAMKGTHFYYIGMAGTQLRTLVYRYGDAPAPQPGIPNETIIRDWITDARASGDHATFRDFNLVGWRWPTYLIFFIDFPGWNYLTDPEDNNRMKALHFAAIPERGPLSQCHANYSFYNARILKIQIGQNWHDLLLAENYHFKAPIGGGASHQPRMPGDETIDYYKYDIFMGVDIEGSDQKMWFTVDPGGKNLGPP